MPRGHRRIAAAVMRRIRNRSRVWFGRQPFPDRHENPYATHLPVLAALACILPIRRVVEFGSGLNSTPAFLNRGVFPDLIKLQSFENDLHWLNEVQSTLSDPRLDLKSVTGAMCSAVDAKTLKEADLVLIDDSTSAADRASTVRAAIQNLEAKTLLVIHDFEIPDYQQAAEAAQFQYVFRALCPATGVVGLDPSINRQTLNRANRLIRRYHSIIPITSIAQWQCLFKSYLQSKL